MKFLIIIACCVTLSWATQTDDFWDTIRNRLLKSGKVCKKEVGASDEDTLLIKGQNVPVTTPAKCYISCISKYIGVMNQDGTVNEATIDQFINELKEFDENLASQFKEINAICLKEVKVNSDHCQTSYDFFVCFQREIKARGITQLDW